MPKIARASNLAILPEGRFLRLPPLSREFYNRDPQQVGKELLGKILIRKGARDLRAGRIVETEAYLGAGDAAAHAAAGETERNAVIFGPPGHAYVYLSYGLHYCLNVSCLPEGEAGCILIRALEPLAGIPTMARARALKKSTVRDAAHLRMLTSGPARLCQAFGITRPSDNDRDLTDPGSGLWIASDGSKPKKIEASARIGITKSAELPLRYYVAGNPFVSIQRTSSE